MFSISPRRLNRPVRSFTFVCRILIVAVLYEEFIHDKIGSTMKVILMTQLILLIFEI